MDVQSPQLAIKTKMCAINDETICKISYFKIVHNSRTCYHFILKLFNITNSFYFESVFDGLNSLRLFHSSLF